MEGKSPLVRVVGTANSGDLGEQASSTGGAADQSQGNRFPDPPQPISILSCKNPKASLVEKKSKSSNEILFSEMPQVRNDLLCMSENAGTKQS